MARTARQIAASRRNIVKAQAESARSRRGTHRSKKTGHHYGTGKTGRKQARRNKYGSRKHGISIAQQQRRDRRSSKRKRRAGYAVTAAGIAVTAYGQLNPHQKAKIHVKAKDYAMRPTRAKNNYKFGRQVFGETRKQASRRARNSLFPR